MSLTIENILKPVASSSKEPVIDDSRKNPIDDVGTQLVTQFLAADCLRRLYADQMTLLSTALIEYQLQSLSKNTPDIEEKKQKSPRKTVTVVRERRRTKYSTDDERKTANERERVRVQSIGKVLDDLREILPCQHPKLSKVSILRLATHYIGYLGAILEDEDYRPHKELFHKTFDFETRTNKRRNEKFLLGLCSVKEEEDDA
ncbi:unnamed protein product, partial [Mesorhabditis spiculigera]